VQSKKEVSSAVEDLPEFPTRAQFSTQDSTESHEVHQVKNELNVSSYAREKANWHCSKALSEAEAQKHDLIALTTQLQMQKNVFGNSSQEKIAKLQNNIAKKERKMRALRGTLLESKAKFIAAEVII